MRLRTLLILMVSSILVSGCGVKSTPNAANKSASTSREIADSGPADASVKAEYNYRISDETAPAAETATDGATALSSAAPAEGDIHAIESHDYAVTFEERASPTTAPASAPAPKAAEPKSAKPAADARKSESETSSAKRPEGLNRNLQSGLLTAGSFDDVAKFDAFQDFLAKTLQNDPSETYPRFAVGERVLIQVVDGQGSPVGDARVVVQAADAAQTNNKSLIDLETCSDGRVTLLTGIDGNSADQSFVVTVHPPNDGQPVSRTLKLDERPWTITLKDTEHAPPKQLDLALVIDTTGSMGDELEYLKVEIDSIAATIAKMFPEVDQRYSVVLYRDEGDTYVTRTFDFTSSLQDFRQTLAEQSANGGGDYPEAMHLAMEQAAGLSWRKRDTARVMFLVGDAPPHDQHAGRALDAAKQLRQQGVRVFPIAGSGVAWQAEFVMRATSFLTMGQYLFLTDHSGVGLPHAKPHVPEFQVERLDRLMIRMIASELAGKRLVPDEVIAIERGDEISFGEESPDIQQRPSSSSPNSPSVNAETDSNETSDDLSSTSRWVFFALLFAGVFAYDTLVDRRGRDA